MTEQKYITLRCKCGTVYDSPIGNKRYRMDTQVIESRYHICPNCKHVWDLRPDLPKPPSKEVDGMIFH